MDKKPLNDAAIESVETLNAEFVLLVFSNGTSMKLAMEKLRQLALAEGMHQVTEEEAKADE